MGFQIGVSPLGGNGIDLRMLYYTYVACVMWPIHLKSSVKFSLVAFFPRSFGQLKSNLDFSTKTSSQVDLFSSSAICFDGWKMDCLQRVGMLETE